MLIRLFLFWLLAFPAQAQLYSKEELAEARAVYEPNVRLMIEQDIARKVPRALRPQAAGIRMRMPDAMGHPLSFFSDSRNGIVYVPVTSVKFVDELAITQAWFTARGCDQRPIATYLWGLLRARRDLPPPLEAFGIDIEDARADEFVWDVSGKVLKSAMLFIFAHEVGHILLGHSGDRAGPAGQAQELAADDFALDQFAAIGTVPGGAALYFFAGRWLDPVGEAQVANSHPIAPERIAAIARRLEEKPIDFSFSEPDGEAAVARTRMIAFEMGRIAELASGDGLLTLLPEGLQRDFPLSRLSRACPS